MIRPVRPLFRAITMSALCLVLAAALSACGRKGGLDPPPAAVAQPGTEAAPAVDAEGRPIAPRGPSRRLPIDWLLE
ncbi:MAG: lipoprotein [Xanthobacteraceae bacterium]|nr:lipoprotein [Xanthobacteraceae bacterium]